MDRLINADCWLYVLDYLRSDRHTLFQLLLVHKSMFRLVVPVLYRRPLIDFRLHHEAEKELLELLRQKPSVRRSRRILNALPSTIDYYALVQEMPSPFSTDRYWQGGRFQLTKPDIVAYLCHFGPKIKEMRLRVEHVEIVQNRTRALSQLHTLILVNEDMVSHGITDESKHRFRQTIQTHRIHFPGMLKKVSYLHGDTMERVDDPTMMLMIRDVMDGDWSLDALKLLIHCEEDEDLLRVLQDIDLPRKLKSVAIYFAFEEPPSCWDEPLKLFLSRCRVLDRVEFENVYQAELLSWIFEEHQQKAMTGEAMSTRDPVQWKSVSIRVPCFEEEDVDWIVTLAGRCREFWNCIVTGLGHCLEKFEFYVEVPAVCRDIFPILSLPATISLPNLHSLSIQYPNISKVAYSGIERLRDLRFEIVNVHLVDDDQWPDWENWKSVESLDVTCEGDIGIFERWQSHPTTGVEELEENTEVEFKRPHHQTLNTVQLSNKFILPGLKEVMITDFTTNRMQLYWLFIAPNLSKLSMRIENKNTLGLFVDFFKEADDRSLVFPNLREIHISPLTVNHENAIYISRFIGLTPGIDMFPGLEDITLGRRKYIKPRGFFREQFGHSHSNLEDAVIAAFPPWKW